MRTITAVLLCSGLALGALACSHPTMRSTPEASSAVVDDSELASRVALALHGAGVDGREDVWIDVTDGVVTFRQAPADAAARDRMAAIARGVEGVREVRMADEPAR